MLLKIMGLALKITTARIKIDRLMSLNIRCLQYHIVQDTNLAGGRYKK